jgi:hypothetical protein
MLKLLPVHAVMCKVAVAALAPVLLARWVESYYKVVQGFRWERARTLDVGQQPAAGAGCMQCGLDRLCMHAVNCSRQLLGVGYQLGWLAWSPTGYQPAAVRQRCVA